MCIDFSFWQTDPDRENIHVPFSDSFVLNFFCSFKFEQEKLFYSESLKDELPFAVGKNIL